MPYAEGWALSLGSIVNWWYVPLSVSAVISRLPKIPSYNPITVTFGELYRIEAPGMKLLELEMHRGNHLADYEDM